MRVTIKTWRDSAVVDRQAVDQEKKLHHEIEQGQARQAEPKLVGRIHCLAHETHHHPSEPQRDYGDCWFTMSVNIWNDGGVPTNVTGFRFLVRWASSGDDWPTRRIEGLDRFRVRSFSTEAEQPCARSRLAQHRQTSLASPRALCDRNSDYCRVAPSPFCATR